MELRIEIEIVRQIPSGFICGAFNSIKTMKVIAQCLKKSKNIMGLVGKVADRWI